MLQEKITNSHGLLVAQDEAANYKYYQCLIINIHRYMIISETPHRVPLMSVTINNVFLWLLAHTALACSKKETCLQPFHDPIIEIDSF